MLSPFSRGDYFRFSSVFIKKNNQTEFFFLKKKPKPGQTDRFWFGFFRAKTGSNWFGSVFSVLARFSRFWLGFFSVWLGFFGLARFFRFESVLARFGSVFFRFFIGFGSVRFGFFGFLFIKPKPNQPVF